LGDWQKVAIFAGEKKKKKTIIRFGSRYVKSNDVKVI
jgi:hypothetical protein